MSTQIKLSKKAIEKANNKQFILKLAGHMNKDVQTINKWLKDNSVMLTLYQCYSFIQREFKLSDKDMFEEVKFKK